MFDLADLTPHGFCLAWDPGLVWLQAGSDLAIAIAYYSIPLVLIRFAKLRRDLVFPWIFRLFAAFIVACGTTHVMGVLTLWEPLYWIDGWLKFITAILSVGTAALLWPLLPKALQIPSQEQLRTLNRQLEAEIAERAALTRQLQSIYTRTPAPLQTLDMEGRLVEVSDQWLDLLGYGREEVLGRRLSAFQASGRDGWAALKPLIHAGAVRDQEEILVHRDGSERHVLVSVRLERDAAGAPALAVAALTDITRRKETEAALEASEAHLRQAQKMEAVGQLTGGIAHDFNNMLTGVNCVMELLKKRLPEGDGSRRLVSSVLETSNRAAKLTAQLLAFSRRQRLVAEPVDPVEVARTMGGLLTHPLGEHIRLAILSDAGGHRGEAWPCLADRNQLEAALLNLVLNARAAIEGAGTITIEVQNRSAGADDETHDAVPGEDPLMIRDYVAISVRDTGHGMTGAVRRQAFEPFFTTKPVGQGTGLGLSQTYGFARQSGGTVRIESAPGAGTTVTILLPRAAEAARTFAAPPIAPAGEPRLGGHGETVLLVEDEDTLREVVAAALMEHGYRVVQAPSGDAAVVAFEQAEHIDLVFTDIVMPGALNGVEMAMKLRQSQPQLPVLFATGYSDRRVLERWSGPLHLLSKPYSIDAVAHAIDHARATSPA